MPGTGPPPGRRSPQPHGEGPGGGIACNQLKGGKKRKEEKNNNNNNAELLNGFLMNKTNPIDAACVFKPIQLSADAIKIIRRLT